MFLDATQVYVSQLHGFCREVRTLRRLYQVHTLFRPQICERRDDALSIVSQVFRVGLDGTRMRSRHQDGR